MLMWVLSNIDYHTLLGQVSYLYRRPWRCWSRPLVVGNRFRLDALDPGRRASRCRYRNLSRW